MSDGPVDSLFDRFVALGDSLSQGAMSVGVSIRSQRYGIPALLARQAGARFRLPLLAEPGFPPHIDRLPDVLRSRVTQPDLLEGRRLDPTVEADNLAVAGMRLLDLVGLSPARQHRARTYAVARLVRLVFNPLGLPAWEALSPVDRAVAARPTCLLIWIGANDVLEGFFYPKYGFTPPALFAHVWRRMIARLLAETSAHILVATIPDVTVAPLLQGWLRRYPRLRRLVGDLIARHNGVIRATAAAGGRVTVLDLEDALAHAAAHGQSTRGWRLTSRVRGDRLAFAPLVGIPGYITGGGLVSFDGLHPTPTGYGLICGELMDGLTRQLGIRLPPINLEELAREDPMLRAPDPYSWSLLRLGTELSYGVGVARLARRPVYRVSV